MKTLSTATLSNIPTFRKRMAYIPFEKGTGGARIGVSLLPPDKPWFEFDEDYEVQTCLKRELLGNPQKSAFCYREFSGRAQYEAVVEVSKAISTWLERHHDIVLKGWEKQNLWVVSQHVQDDLCIMQKNEKGKWVLTAASVCFPTSWDLNKMLGKENAAIHSEVGDDRFRDAMDRKMDDVRTQLVWRVNWFLYASPAIRHDYPNKLYEKGWKVDGLTKYNAGSKLFIRYERQTLRLFPGSGAILFTIRPYVDPLRSLKENHPDFIPDFVNAYHKHKTAGSWCEPMFDYLECHPCEV